MVDLPMELLPEAPPTDLAPASFKHVDYVLLAEFDIDEGSVLRYQYPNPTGAHEQ